MSDNEKTTTITFTEYRLDTPQHMFDAFMACRNQGFRGEVRGWDKLVGEETIEVYEIALYHDDLNQINIEGSQGQILVRIGSGPLELLTQEQYDARGLGD